MDFILDFLPKENYFFLFYLFGVFIFSVFLIYFFAKKSKNKPDVVNNKKELTINDLLKIASNPKSNINDLMFVLQYFNDNIDFKKDIKSSLKLLKTVLNHKNRNKSLFDYFHGSLLPKHLEFKDELNRIEKEALNK